jgi:acylglycerol lipase
MEQGAQSQAQSTEQAKHLGLLQPKGFPGLPSDWTSDWEKFSSRPSEPQLFAVTHHQKDWKNPRALIVLHGLGEHGGRYLHFPHYLKDVVGAVHCIDQRGHGRAGGLRGHCDSWDQLSDDLISAIRRFQTQMMEHHKRPEIHLFAHSMGGLVALHALYKDANLPLASVNISAPLLGIRVPVSSVKKGAGRVLSRAWPNLQMKNEIDVNLVSHDPEVVSAYQNDRLVHGLITPRMYTEMVRAMDEVHAKTEGWNYPVQFYVPLKEGIVSEEATLKFYKALNSAEKSEKSYPDFFHESFNEPEKERAFEDLRAWILSHSNVS